MIETAIILAAGSKAHQSQLIYNRPRTMLPALGKPLVVRVMDRLYRIGIKKFVVVLGEQEGNVATYLNSKWHPNVEIEFVLKPSTLPLGKILPTIAKKHTEPVLIAGYNSFTHGNFPARLIKYHELSPDDLILTGAMNSLSKSDTQNFAQIKLPDTGEVGYTTTPRSAAEKITAISPSASDSHQNLFIADIAVCGTKFMAFLQNLPQNATRKDTLIHLFSAYIQAEQPARIARAGWVLQVQNDSDLITLNRHLLDEKLDAHILSEIPYTVRIVEPVRIDPGVSIGQGAVVGPYVYLEAGCSVGRGVRLSNSIVLGRASLTSKEPIQNCIISTRGRLQL